ncbi:GNAT family N-acetyltransferase [Stackebrandtia soli]|uniref:GNAT family N-acetyltransferase n=1 Tax=Stackebrandtia soli TaxID=1892856 RepID=UPI0039E9166E
MFAVSLREDAELRPLDVWHAEEFAEHMDRARDHIRPWVGAAFVTKDVDAARNLLRRYADRRAADEGGLFGIWLGGRLVGGVLFVSFNADWGNFEVGCWLEPSAEGRGLITAGCETLLEWSFRVRGMHRAEWKCRADNERSAAVAKRLGMTLEGESRECWPYEGRRYNKQEWAVLAPDWRSENG